MSFADPDDAVRERIRDLGLSAAARDLDETIRASKVPDSNVADTVEDRVGEFVDDADEEAFDAAGDQQREADSSAGDETDAAGGDTDAGGDGQVTMEDYL